MSLLVGKYQFVKNDKYYEYLRSLGPEVTEEIATKLDEAKPTIDVTVTGNVCDISSTSGRGQKFTFGDTFDEELFPGITVKTTASLKGSSVEVLSKFVDGRGGCRIYEFSQVGLVIKYSNDKCNATRTFKRI